MSKRQPTPDNYPSAGDGAVVIFSNGALNVEHLAMCWLQKKREAYDLRDK
jgi:hypothetical protein